jgi:TM2 domain-containing membrane protein YozV
MCPMGEENKTHSVFIGYVLWIFGFTGSHRFYFGKPISGTVYFFTLGLLGIGWLVDIFLISSMDRQAENSIPSGKNQLYGCMTAAYLSGSFGNPPHVYGQVDKRHYLPVHTRGVRNRVYLRFLDAERSNNGYKRPHPLILS